MSDYADIRPDVIESLNAWAYTGRPTGGFLYAVLTNDLKEAIGRADDDNRAALVRIVQYIYNELPSACWGSPEKVDEWANARAGVRL